MARLRDWLNGQGLSELAQRREGKLVFLSVGEEAVSS